MYGRINCVYGNVKRYKVITFPFSLVSLFFGHERLGYFFILNRICIAAYLFAVGYKSNGVYYGHINGVYRNVAGCKGIFFPLARVALPFGHGRLGDFFVFDRIIATAGVYAVRRKRDIVYYGRINRVYRDSAGLKRQIFPFALVSLLFGYGGHGGIIVAAVHQRANRFAVGDKHRFVFYCGINGVYRDVAAVKLVIFPCPVIIRFSGHGRFCYFFIFNRISIVAYLFPVSDKGNCVFYGRIHGVYRNVAGCKSIFFPLTDIMRFSGHFGHENIFIFDRVTALVHLFAVRRESDGIFYRRINRVYRNVRIYSADIIPLARIPLFFGYGRLGRLRLSVYILDRSYLFSVRDKRSRILYGLISAACARKRKRRNKARGKQNKQFNFLFHE